MVENNLTVYLCGFFQSLYDSVAQYDRQISLWKLQVSLSDLVRSFYCDMNASGTLLEDNEVTNGFHQGNGCTMAPNLMPAVQLLRGSQKGDEMFPDVP